jgi:CheY-like chemotaxis protein
MMAQRLLLHIAASHAESLEQANILARIGEALEGAETMLSRLMDLAALELGKVPVERKVFRLDAQLAAIVAESAGEAERKGLLLRLRAPPCWSESDPMLLGRILRNLIVNAVRHTSRGWVLVAVRRRDQQYRIEIRDSGRGIPSEQQGMIFEEFRQLGNPERGRAKGQGLGLAIVARTAGLLGHRISLRSTVDRGSVFSIEVPIQAEQAGHQNCATALPPLTYPVSILLIEDDPLQAAALEGILVDAGHRVAVADRVAAAIASVSDTLDLIVTDYRLPGGASGLEAIMTIRRIAGRTIPAVLLTGDTQATIVAEAAAVGCQVLHKPCSPAAVLDAIARTAAASRAVFDAGFRDAT